MQVSQEELPQGPRNAINGKTLHDGEYLVREMLGDHGLSNVFLATHAHLSIPLALKQIQADQPLPEHVIAELDYILHGGDITRYAAYHNQALYHVIPLNTSGTYTDQFLREALLLARLQHPAIPTLYDYFAEEGHWYLVIDYIPGTSLGSYIRQHAPLPPREALNYALQICDVLDYLHQQSPPIIFWDLQPDTIMRSPDGTLFLTGFGKVHSLTEPGDNQETAQAITEGQLAASSLSPYAAPEQQDEYGFTHVDTRADLYSLGLILYEMLSGQSPAEQSSSELSLSARSTSSYTLLPEVSHMLSSLIKLAIQPEPAERFQSAQTFYLALERAYQVEERRCQQQHLVTLTMQENDDSDHELTDDIAEEEIEGDKADTSEKEADSDPLLEREDRAGIAPHVPDLQQRRLTREALHRTRQERLDQERLELQLASFDESLTRRTSMSQALSTIEVRQQATGRHMPAYDMRRITQVSFFLALVLFLVMASLLAYARFTQNSSSDQGGPKASTTTTANPGMVKKLPSFPTANYNNGPASNWQTLPLLPQPFADNAATYLQQNGNAYVYANGGYHGPTSPSHYDHSLYRFDIAHRRWMVVSNNQFPGMVNNAATTDEYGNIFFTAGYAPDSTSIPSLIYMYQASKGQLVDIATPASMPLGFANALFADHQGHLYMTQGIMLAGHATAVAGNGWYRYDIASGHWQRLAAVPVGLGNAVLTGDDNGTIMLFGGSRDAGQQHQTRTIYLYDIASNSWSQSATSLPQAISGASGCGVWPGQYVIIGGYDATRDHSMRNTWLFDLHTLKARALAPTPASGSTLGSSACDGHGHVYVIRGTDNPQLPTRDFWELLVQPGLAIPGK